MARRGPNKPRAQLRMLQELSSGFLPELQYRALTELRAMGEATLPELAAQLHREPSTVRPWVTCLLEQGLVAKRRGSGERRVVWYPMS